MILEIHEINPQARLIKRAVEVLEKGGLIVYPTDTVYAYGCDILSKKAIDTIYRLKKIDRKKPLSFIFSDISAVSEYARLVSNEAYKTMKRLLPGPYTFIFEASKLVPRIVTTNQKTIGIRIPDNNIAIELVRTLGRPILSASVNTLSGEYVVDPGHLEAVYANEVDLVIDAGQKISEPSTIVDFSSGAPELLRKGKGEWA